MKHGFTAVVLMAFVCALTPHQAYAIRPFVTDDARVVGRHLGQIETWLVGSHYETIHNVLGAVGPTDWLEITTGFAHGGAFSGPGSGYSITGPLFQFKALAREAKSGAWPGVAFAAGVLPPIGEGALTPQGVGTFGYLMATQALLDDDLLLHVNVGVKTTDIKTQWLTTTTGGFGFQARAIGNWHAVGEIYHGDPYDPLLRTGASQIGFRYIPNERVQFDGTLGSTLAEDSEQWWTFGVRLVSDPLW